MQDLLFIKQKISTKGFAFSLDAFIAVILVVSALFLFVSINENPSLGSQSSTIVEDSLFALDQQGYIIYTIDNESLSQSANLIKAQLLDYLPNGFDANVILTRYFIDTDACAINKNFASCFPDINKTTYSSAGSPPDGNQSEIITGKKFYLKRQPPGECNISYLEFAGPIEKALDRIPIEKDEGALFSTAYLEEESPTFDFNAIVEPNPLICDEQALVTLTITSDSALRKPIEIMVVMDRSRPYDDFGPETTPDTDKAIMIDFLNNANWTNSRCSQATTDCIGVAAYSDDSSLPANLHSSLNSAISSIKNLKRDCGNDNPNPCTSDPTKNAVYEGVSEALEELIDYVRPQSQEFVVVLSDAADNSDSKTFQDVVDTAVDNNITIFSVGVGLDANSTTDLVDLATSTGGEYYYAEDQSALSTLYDLIADRISNYAVDSNINIPVQDGLDVNLSGGGSVIDGNIIYVTGSTEGGTVFTIQYYITVPCDSGDICGNSIIQVPDSNTVFTYVLPDGTIESITFPDENAVLVDLYARDLNVDITSGSIIGNNDIQLNVRVGNGRELDANSTTLRFRYGDDQGPIIATRTVDPLCGNKTGGCTAEDQIRDFTVNLNQEGVIYATINDDNAMSECPLYNVDAVNCYGAPVSEIYVVEYNVWRT